MTTLLLRCVALAVVLVVAGTPWAEAEINRQVMEEQHDDADGEAGSSEEGVVALSEDTFREEVERGQPLLVYYYTKWCRHCVATGPMIEALPAELRDQDDLDDLDVIKVAKVDVEAEKGLAEQQGISGFPTIRLYKDGRRDEFYGERSLPSLVQWLKRKMGLGVQRLQSMSDARKMLADHPVVTVGFFKDADSDQATMLKAASAALDKTPFAVVHDEEMFSEYGVEDGTVVVFKQFDERRVDVLLAHSAASLTGVLRRAARPLVADFRREDAHEISSAAGNANRTLFVAFLSKRAGHYELLHDTLHAVALEHVNNVSLVAVNVDDDDSDPVKAAFSLANTTAMPAMRMYNFATGHRYEPRTDRMTADAVRDFVAGVQSGALKPTNAVDAPEEQVTDVQNGVKSLTTATFDREVYDGRHHALVLFYTNSCPHCNTFKPVFEEVAAAVAGEPSLTMAKIDMGKYRPKSTGVEIEGVPYVVMYPRCGKDSPLVYGGSREPAALLEFVENHSGLAVRKARSVSARGAGRGKDREEL